MSGRKEITNKAQLRGLPGPHALTVVMALDVGWHATFLGGGAVRIESPDKTHSIRIPNSTRVNDAQVKRWQRIIRESAGVRRVAAVAFVDGLVTGEDTTTYDAVLDKAWEEDRIVVEEPAAPKPKKPEPEVVSVYPWLAKKSPAKDGGKLYESEAVLERKWSDGRVDWACAFPGCDYGHPESTRSVANHYARAHVHTGQAEPVTKNPPAVLIDPSYTEPLTHRLGSEYTPSQRLLAALADFLGDRENWVNGTAEDVALLALTWMHDRPDLPEPELRATAPLTDEQIVQRIRLLVGGRDPELEAEVADLRARTAAQTTQLNAAEALVSSLEAQVMELTAQRDKSRNDLQAFKELALGLEA